MKNYRIAIPVVLVLAAVLTAVLTGLFSPAEVERVSGPMAHHAYVWQRAWGPAVTRAVEESRDRLSRLIVLAAEVSFRNGSPRVVRVSLDYGTLARHPRPVGIALRIGPYSGPFDSDCTATRLVCGVAGKLVNNARKAGLEPAELQLDFDCAESKLSSYRRWVEAVRAEVMPTPVTITTLPCWLKHGNSFERLVSAADGYVLQVHSFELPKARDEEPRLCDPDAARRYVETAARFGKPFRVALPTYGYTVAFDPDGKLLGITAEGAGGQWSGRARVCTVRANPDAMAMLVREWTNSRPSYLSGIAWYRLPVATDMLNWRWPTLEKVMDGVVPKPKAVVETRHTSHGLIELDIFNAGTADASLDLCVAVRWQDARVVASDALGGFRGSAAQPDRFHLTGPGSPFAPRLGPGERKTIGWIRFSRDVEVNAVVLE